MKHRLFIHYIYLFLIVLLVAGCGKTPDLDFTQHQVIIGTGGINGMYYPTGRAICKIVNKEKRDHGVSCGVESTKGSVDNIKGVKRGDLQFGIARSDWIHAAYRGTSFWKGDPQKNLRTIFSMYSEYLHIVADSKLNTIHDLRGKAVNIAKPKSNARFDILNALHAFGISQDDLVVSNTGTKKAVGLFKKGHLDAFICTVGHPSGYVKEASNSRNVHIIPLEGPEVDTLITQYPFYEKTAIPTDHYSLVNNENKIPTFGYKTIFFTSAEASEEDVYHITKSIFNNLENFKRLHLAFSELTHQNMVHILKDLAPIHPGALRYYQEIF